MARSFIRHTWLLVSFPGLEPKAKQPQRISQANLSLCPYSHPDRSSHIRNGDRISFLGIFGQIYGVTRWIRITFDITTGINITFVGSININMIIVWYSFLLILCSQHGIIPVHFYFNWWCWSALNRLFIFSLSDDSISLVEPWFSHSTQQLCAATY